MSKRIHKAIDAVHEFALALPGAHEDHPWGEVAIKVDKKVFVFLGSFSEEKRTWNFTVKLPESGYQVLDLPIAAPTGYGLGKSGWVSITATPTSVPPIGAILSWVEESYRAIAKKKRIAELDALQP